MKKLLKVFIAVLAIVIAFSAWSWFSAKKNLADYVVKVQPGMQLTDARAYANQMGLKYVATSRRDDAGQFRDLVTATGVMGRHVCEILHDGTVVVKVERNFHD